MKADLLISLTVYLVRQKSHFKLKEDAMKMVSYVVKLKFISWSKKDSRTKAR